MDNQRITVIIPAYNAEAYLPACLDSVLRQTHADLEILLIDDGSGDGTGKICDEYAARDGRIRVMHRENGGLSRARNAALELVTGDWITFLDADDLLVPTACGDWLRAAREQQADLVIGREVKFFGNPPEPEEQAGDPEILTGREAVLRILYRRLPCYACGKLYARETLGDLRFPEGKQFEDLALVPRIVSRAQRVAVLPKTLYLYRQVEGSIVHARMSEKRLVQLEILAGHRDFFRQDEEILRALQSRTFMCCANLEGDLFEAKDFPKNLAAPVHQGAQDTRRAALRDGRNKGITRLYALISFLGIRPLGFTVSLRNKIQRRMVRK